MEKYFNIFKSFSFFKKRNLEKNYVIGMSITIHNIIKIIYFLILLINRFHFDNSLVLKIFNKILYSSQFINNWAIISIESNRIKIDK